MNLISKPQYSPSTFDPNGSGIKGNLFGLPFSPETSSLVIIPVPWAVTVSYNTGTSLAPKAILDASLQVDLFLKDIPDAWQLGVSMLPVPRDLEDESSRLRELTTRYVARLESHELVDDDPLLKKINEACEDLNIYVKSTVTRLMRDGKMVGLLGGDHSPPLGFFRAL